MSTDLIDPSTIFVPKVEPAELESAADDIRKQGGKIAQTGQDIKSSWAGLASCYTAPEDDTLLAVVDPVADKGDEVDGDLGEVATALETFAATARDLKKKLQQAQDDAEAFRESIKGDDDWDDGGLMGGESEKVQEHNELLNRVNSLVFQYQQAERDCANKITSLFDGGTTFVGASADGSTQPGAGEKVYGTKKPVTEGKTPWGKPQGSDDWFWVDSADATVGFVNGMLEDAGGKFGLHGEQGWFAGSAKDNAEDYWTNALAGLGASIGVWNPQTGERTESWAEGLDVAKTSWLNAAHSIVPWTELEDRPGYVWGTMTANAGMAALGVGLSMTVVGAPAGSALIASRVTRVFDGLGNGKGPFGGGGDGGGHGGDGMSLPDLLPNGSNGGAQKPPDKIGSEEGFDLSDLGDMNESLGDLEASQRPAPRWQPEPAPDFTPEPDPAHDAPTRPTPEADQQPDQQDAPEPERPADLEGDKPPEQDPSRLDPTAEEVDDSFAEMARRNEDLGDTMDAEDDGRMAELDGEDPWSIEALKDPEGDAGRDGPDDDARVPVTPDGMEMSHHEAGNGNEGSGGDPTDPNQDGSTGRVEVTEDQQSGDGQGAHGTGQGTGGPPPPPSGGGPSWPDPDDRIDPSSPDPDMPSVEQPGSPMLDAQEPHVRQVLKTSGLNGQKIDDIVKSLKDPGEGYSVGMQVADIILEGRVTKVKNFSEFVTDFANTGEQHRLESGAELRFVNHLIDRGYPIQRLEFESSPPNKSQSYDIDSFVRSGQVDDYAYQVKRLKVGEDGVTAGSQLVNNSFKIGKQLGVVNDWQGFRGVGILEANAPLEGLTQKQYQSIERNARKFGIVYKVFTPNGSFTVPPGSDIFPSVLNG